MMKTLCAQFLLFGSLLFAQATSLPADIRILESNGTGLTLEYRPTYGATMEVKTGEETYALPVVESSVPSPKSLPGEEDIRSRQVLIALPGYDGHRITVIASDAETVQPFPLAPVPSIEPVDHFGTIKKTYAPNFRSRGDFFPSSIAEIHGIGKTKGIVTGYVMISPYQYQSSTRTLKRYSRIVVRVDFGPSTVPQDISGTAQWARPSIVNYNAAQQWSAQRRMAKTSAVHSVLATGTWIKMEVTESGIYKIDAAYLRGVGIDPAALSSITEVKVFGRDGQKIPENLSVPRPADLPQIAVDYTDVNGNGKFDNDDYLLFYGEGVSGWTYNASQKIFSHFVNPYSFSNYYFLSAGSVAPVMSVPTVSVTASSGGVLHQATGKVFFDEDKYNFNQSGQDWVSSPINPGESRTVSTKLTGWIPGTSVTYKYSVYGRSPDATSMTLEESGKTIATPTFFSVDYSGYQHYASPRISEATIVPALTDQRSNVKFSYNSTSTISSGYIGWLEMHYRQQLTAENDILVFSSPDTSGVLEFDIDGFSTNAITVFDITTSAAMRKLSYQLQQPMGALRFKDTLSSGMARTYWVGTPSQYKVPKSSMKIPNSNLHAAAGAQFIIITHSEFKSEAVRLQKHKESLPGNKKLSTMVVDVDTLYNEFGNGTPDPGSIRDFLRHAVQQWSTPPTYVLLFGDGNYDVRGILKNDRNWVPTFETAESNFKISSYANEDFFSYLQQNAATTVSIAAGRLTPRSAAQAKILVDRIIMYETALPKGRWKNMVTFVADDMWTPSSQFESEHIQQSEEAAQLVLQRQFDVKRIYMEEYPTVFASTGRRKPDVRTALLDQVNNKGSLLLNYVGHGNPKVWAHESILTQDDSRTQFTNGDKLTFIVAATCDWGRFDEAGEQSSAEDVMVASEGGAIGVLSANRAVYSRENALTNRQFYHFLLSSTRTLRLGDAYMLMKNSMTSFNDLENKQKYFLLADPTLALGAPEGTILIDSLTSVEGMPLDTIRALDKIIVKGTVRDTANAVMAAFSGKASLAVFDAEKTKTVAAIPWFSYKENGAVIYNGDATVDNGVVTAAFIVPKDISYTNKSGQIAVYFSNSAFDGKGYHKGFIVGGSNPNAPVDSVGPAIAIYFDNTNFRSGDVVNEQPTLIVSLKDSSGINSSTNSIGHRLEAWIDGSSKSVDLTEYYQGKTDSYMEGSAQVALENLSQGNHSIKVRAWDVYNNSSMADAFFVVASSDALSIQQLYNFPNPVSTSTSFTFQHNQSVPIDVSLKIYTVAGRMIHTIERSSVADRFVKIDWNRRDSDGDEVGNGVYFYKVIAKTVDGRYSSEAIGKMAIVR